MRALVGQREPWSSPTPTRATSPKKKKRSRDEARIYPVYLIPRDPSLARGKHLPLHAAADAMARALITEWSITDLKVIHRGAEATAIKNSFKVAMNEEELARRLRLFYSEKTNKSIMVKHKDYKGVETDIPYICTKERILKEHGKERITVEAFAAGDYKINKSDITQALEDLGLIITSGNANEVHQPALGPTCPLRSNKMITRVTPPGHTSLEGGVLTLRDAAHAFRWPKNLMVKIYFEGEDEPHRIQLRYKVYGDGLLDGELELCRTCHQHKRHLRDCPNRQAKKKDRKAKMSEYSRKIVEENKSGNQCGWFALGLCFHQRECRLTHSK